jgi:hypothetical protein
VSDHDVRLLVTIGVCLVIYQVVLGPIVLVFVRDYLKTRRERNNPTYPGRHGKNDGS